MISGTIAIFDAVTKIYSDVEDSEDLPQAFGKVARRLPLVQNVLRTAKTCINEYNPDKGSCRAIETTVGCCEDKAEGSEASAKATKARQIQQAEHMDTTT